MLEYSLLVVRLFLDLDAFGEALGDSAVLEPPEYTLLDFLPAPFELDQPRSVGRKVVVLILPRQGACG